MNVFTSVRWSSRLYSRFFCHIALCTVLSLIGSYLNTLESMYTGFAVDSMVNKDVVSFCSVLVRVMVVLLASFIVATCNTWYTYWLNKKITTADELRLLSRICYSSRNASSEAKAVINAFLNDSSEVRNIFISVFPSVIVSVFTGFIIGIRLFRLRPFFLFYSVIVSILPLLLNYHFSLRSRDLSEIAKPIMDDYLSELDECVSTHCEICANKNSSFFIGRFTKRLSSIFTITRKSTVLSTKSSAVNFVINVGNNILLFVIIALLVFNDETSVGTFVTVIAYVNQMKSIFSSVSSSVSSIVPVEVSVCRVRHILESENFSIRDTVRNSNKIEINNLSFAYPDKCIFSDFSLYISKPGLYLIKGSNGSGKTTLLNMVAGIIPQKALIRGWIRCDTGSLFYLTPESILYTVSVKENICFDRDYDDDRILECVKLFGLDNVITDKSDLYKVVHREISFSSGESRRLLLLRMIFSDADILLLDEVETNLDSQSVTALKKILSDFISEKTILLATHCSYFDDISMEVIFL